MLFRISKLIRELGSLQKICINYFVYDEQKEKISYLDSIGNKHK
jgi:hypothetical protein